MSVNVNRNVLDTFYRYKMPKILAKVEGKGNGIKTVIVNMIDVAKALSRPPTYPTKFFGCELGAQTQFDFKNDRYIVNGSHEASKLQSLLDVFIRKYVLCPECENPETDLWPNDKKGIIKQTCKACGYQGLIDMRHKLTTFILKNPPGMKPDQQGTSLTRKKDRKKEQEKNDRSHLRPGSPIQEHSDNSDSMSLNGDDYDDGEWTADISEDAVKERMNDLTAGVKGLTMDDDAEKPLSERLEIFFNFCNRKKADGLLVPNCDKVVIKDVVGEAERLEIRENKAVMVLIEVLFDENIYAQIPAYRELFKYFNGEKVQRYLLGAIEKLIEVKSMFGKSLNICKLLYDADYVDEEVFKEWHKKQSKKYVSREACTEIHEKVAPFIQWLYTAEEESDDDEDDIEIVYDEKAASKSLKEQCEKKEDKPAVAELANGAADAAADDDSDVDIDNL